MKESFIKDLRCPACRENNFNLDASPLDDREVRQAKIICQSCSKYYDVNKGLIFLHDFLSQEAIKEREVTSREFNLNKELNEREKKMEFLSHENAFSLLALLSSRKDLGGKKVLEIGAATGWLSASLAKDNDCVALDTYYKYPTGLEVAEKYFIKDGIYFERVVADMVALPFIDGSFDVVVVCAALHHSSDINLTMSEIFRVLKPGGKLFLISEPNTGWLGTKERLAIQDDLEHGFNEKRYTVFQWLSNLRRAGFEVTPLLPENMSSVLKYRKHFLLAKIWDKLFKTSPIRFIMSYLILTIFDGFFNIVAIKSSKK